MRGVLFFLRRPRRMLVLLGSVVGAVLYVWYTAVRAVPNVKRRKAERRRAWEEFWKA